MNATLPRVSNDAAILTKRCTTKSFRSSRKKGAQVGLDVGKLAVNGYLQMGAAIVGDDNKIQTLSDSASENITNIGK